MQEHRTHVSKESTSGYESSSKKMDGNEEDFLVAREGIGDTRGLEKPGAPTKTLKVANNRTLSGINHVTPGSGAKQSIL